MHLCYVFCSKLHVQEEEMLSFVASLHMQEEEMLSRHPEILFASEIHSVLLVSFKYQTKWSFKLLKYLFTSMYESVYLAAYASNLG